MSDSSALRIIRPGPRYVVAFHASNGDDSYFDAIAAALPAGWGTATISSRRLPFDVIPSSLEQLAAMYRGLLADALGDAPVVVGGFGVGGVIALACAQDAPREQRPIGLFAIETKIPEPGWVSRPTDLPTMVRVLAEHRARWAELALPVVGNEVSAAERFQRALASSGITVTIDDAERELLLFQRHIQGVIAFRAKPIDMPSLLIGFDGAPPEHDLGWGPIAPHAMWRSVPGDHYTLARAQNRPALAAAISELLAGVVHVPS